MPVGLAPLCPTCFDRVLAWNAAKCPACSKDTPVAQCDVCQQTRPGAFIPENATKKSDSSGGAERFICVDCMEKLLESEVSDAMFNAILAVALSVLAVRYYGRFTFLPIATVLCFLASLWCLGMWWHAATRKRVPSKKRDAAWSLFRRRVEKALAKRPGAHQR